MNGSMLDISASCANNIRLSTRHSCHSPVTPDAPALRAVHSPLDAAKSVVGLKFNSSHMHATNICKYQPTRVRHAETPA